MARRDEYRDQMNTAAMQDDVTAMGQLYNEMSKKERKSVWDVLAPEAQDVITKLKEAA